jgi:predicted ABC-type ATPase
VNLLQILEITSGGDGSGCDPEVAEANGNKCGRPPTTGGQRVSEALKDPVEVKRRSNPVFTNEEVNNPAFAQIMDGLRGREEDLSPWENTHRVQMARALYDAMITSAVQGDSRIEHAGPVRGYTAERSAVHDDILADYKSRFTEPQDKPVVLLTGGLPGAGKSTGLASIDLTGFTVVSADTIKEQMPDYTGSNAAYLHEESSELASGLAQMAMNHRQNVVMDVTLKSFGDPEKGVHDNAAGVVKHFARAGYKVQLIFTDISINKSIQRAMDRYLRDGRFVPPDYVRLAKSSQGNNSKNADTFKALREWPEVEGWRMISTEQDGKVEELGRGGKPL